MVSKQPLTQFSGVTLNNSGRVTKISITNLLSKSRRSIPDELSPMKSATSLNSQASTSDTDIIHILQVLSPTTNTISDKIRDLAKLENLNLSHNDLTGTIPTTIGNLTKLTNLNLSHNYLTGPVPGDALNKVGSAVTDINRHWISISLSNKDLRLCYNTRQPTGSGK